MPLFSIINCSSELDEISPYISPWVILKKFWQFSNTYGDYHSLPPSRRRQFLIDKERCNQAKKTSLSLGYIVTPNKTQGYFF